jgi:hypothetical protein
MYDVLRFVIKFRYVILAATIVSALLGGGLYVRHLQDKVAVSKAELEANRIQQENLRKALHVRQKAKSVSRSGDVAAVINQHRANGWLRVDTGI